MLGSLKKSLLLYEYRYLRVVFGWNKIRISLHTSYIFHMWNLSSERFHWLYDIFHVWKKLWAFWLADIFLPKKFNMCLQFNVNMESDLSTHWGERFMTFCPRKIPKDHKEIHLWFHWHEKKTSWLYFLQEYKSLNGKKFCFYISLVFCCPSVSNIWYLYTYLYTHIINNLLHGWFVCTIFIIHSLWRNNSWIKIVRTHQPWSNQPCISTLVQPIAVTYGEQ